MKEYEIIREIINLCPGNHTRDTFIEEAELPDDADLEAYVRDKFKNEAELKIERIDREDGSVVARTQVNNCSYNFVFLHNKRNY